jgi:V8-like Glu-specific endopeptidase
MRFRRLAAVVAVLVAGGCSSGSPASQHATTAPAPGAAGYWTTARLVSATPMRGYQNRQLPPTGQSANAQPAPVTPQLGALFVREPGGNYFCAASPVASPGHDVLITAAHCINAGSGRGYRKDVVFVPGYQDGQAPDGVWAVRKLLVAPGWARSSDPALDVGFIVLKPHDGQNIQDVLGADKLAINAGYLHLVRVTGYASSAGGPVTCFAWTARQTSAVQRLDCVSFTGGISGSPWVTGFNPATRDGTIVGVTGGYQGGGNTAAATYSPYLGTTIARLYSEATGGT